MTSEINKLFSLEENYEIFDFEFEAYNFPMWIFIRYLFMHHIFNKVFNLNSFNNYFFDYDSLYTPANDKFQYYLKSALMTPFCYKQKDILFFIPPGYETLTDDKIYDDRVFGDFFVAAKSNAITIKNSERYSYKLPSIDKNMKSFDVLSWYIDREKNELSEIDMVKIDEFLKYIQKNLCFQIDDSVYKRSKNILVYYGSRIKPSLKYFNRLFKMFDPKLIVIANAHGMAGYIPFEIFSAKNMGIKIAEVQHGALYNAECFCNFGSAAIKRKSFIKFLPDYLLLYGKHWNKFINTPAERIVIGNNNYYKKEKSQKIHIQKNTILFIDYPGEISEEKSLYSIVLDIVENLPNYKITYRFHPHYKPKYFNEIINKLAKYENIKIDENVDIYASLHANEFVVGGYSTVLYEAACMKKKTFVLRSRFSESVFDSNIIRFYNSATELLELIVKGDYIIISDETKESIMCSSFEKNYFEFLSSFGVDLLKGEGKIKC